MPVHIFKVFQRACYKHKSQYDSKIKWALKPTCGIFTNHTKQSLFWLFLCGSSRSRSALLSWPGGLASWLIRFDPEFSSPKPLSIWQRKHTHMHMNTPPNPRNLHFLNIVGKCPVSRLTLCSILCLPTKVKRARHKHAVTASGPHCQAVFLTVSSLPPLWVSTKRGNPSD